jgi:hypothetical protein
MVGKAQDGDWVSINEAARIMECSKSWVRLLIDRGALAGRKIHARAWMVSRKSAEANVEAYRARAAKGAVGRPRAANTPPAAVPVYGREPRHGVVSTVKGANVKLTAGKLTIPVDDLVAITTAAQLAGVHRSWLHALIARGDVTVIEIDGKPFVRRSEVLSMPERRMGRPPKTR